MKVEVKFVVETELRTDRAVEVEARANVKIEERNSNFVTAVAALASKHNMSMRYESIHTKEFELMRYEILEKFDKNEVLKFFDKFKEDVITLLYDAKELAEKTKMKIEEEYSIKL